MRNQYTISIETDRNRQNFRLKIQSLEHPAYTILRESYCAGTAKSLRWLFPNNQSTDCVFQKKWRNVYTEIFGLEENALSRFHCIQLYTRMQIEKIIRNSNPNWVEIPNTASLNPQTFTEKQNNYYQPGEKFKPNTPNFTSFR